MDDVGPLNSEQEYTGSHYDRGTFAFESERLEKLGPVGFAITCRYLDWYVPGGGAAADVGAGVGHEAGMLGPFYHLRDLAERQDAVKEAGRILKPGGTLFAVRGAAADRNRLVHRRLAR